MSSIASHSLHVAVELTGFGHHPAAEGAPGNLPLIGADYWVDLTEGDTLLDLTAFPVNVIRIRATDLRDAQAQCAQIRAAIAEDGRDPDSVAVLVDLEVLIAPEARAARKELAQLDSALNVPRVPASLHYVGTPSGLGSLIADIRAADVADGVTLLPLSLPRTLEHLVGETIPWLQSRGLVTPATAVDEVLGRFGLPQRQRTLAS
ncbi:hypothetical protein CJ178_23340 [Rhodococcus sp. ACPA4]|uniref:hypothetical protein n=1 Tax=Rhodococcus sp. ACPA4 TaxID=2028571 RepID=UPI000BB162D0|nr:hypothetical protein [Rhodococcus sp. ACPA4]PBC37081.1 hypothetical protein CJ178_23340 [Rhodococcus sp. ACPA4]